jgi:TonB family protein
MSDTWKHWEGSTIDGQFLLLRYLGGTEASAVFLTECEDRGRNAQAAIKLIPVAPGAGDIQLSRWQDAAKLSHPHLIRLYQFGRSELSGVSLLYVVTECGDENLAQILPGRALGTDEVRAMMAPVLEVLDYLHRHGWVHGHIKPANILACGEQLKLSSDGLRRKGDLVNGAHVPSAYDPPELAPSVLPLERTSSPEGDVWSLGMMLVEALTQQLPAIRAAQQQEPVVPESLPEPFLDIARHCLCRHPEKRWTVAQIGDRLQGHAPRAETRSASLRGAKPSPSRAPRPSIPQAGLSPKRRSYAMPIVALALLAAIALLAVPKLLRRGGAPSQPPAAAVEQPPTSTPPAGIKRPQTDSTTQKNLPPMPKEMTSKAPVAVPAVIHPEGGRQEETNTVARMSGETPARGEVVHQVLPEVLESARRTIRGTVRVDVKVNVDRSGDVEDAVIESRGPSKYFAREALEAARLWKFKPSRIGSQGVLSTWILHFEFTQDGTTVTPTQELP